MEREVLTYEIVEGYYKEHQKLLKEGKVNPPDHKCTFTKEARIAFDNGIPLKEAIDDIEKRHKDLFNE